MTSTPQSPTRFRPGSRDTGFPEPFCGQRNTTLPHPDADLSPNACISQDDVAVARVLSRTRRSFLARHKRTISHGLITSDTNRTFLSHSGLGGHHGAGGGRHAHSASLDGPQHNQLYRARSPLATEFDGGHFVETPVATGLTDEDDDEGEHEGTQHGRTLRDHHLVSHGRPSKDGADSLNRTDTTSAGSVADGADEESAALQKAAAATGERPAGGRRRSLLKAFGFGGK